VVVEALEESGKDAKVVGMGMIKEAGGGIGGVYAAGKNAGVNNGDGSIHAVVQFVQGEVHGVVRIVPMYVH